MYYNNKVELKELVGKTFISVKNFENEELIFETEEGVRYILFHDQDCCESVNIEDICGELSDLENSEMIVAEESSHSGENKSGYGTETWTFYIFRTFKGSVTVRWYGESNGYYSESVDLRKEE